MENSTAYLKRHNAYRYLIYHVLSISFMLVTAGMPDTYGGGPCNAGLGMLMYTPIILAGFILALISVAKLISHGREYAPLFWVNFIAFCFLIALVFVR
jgi:hypothetical protein